MGVTDFIIIALMLFSLYLGFQSGFFKQLNDLIILIVVTLVSGLLSDLLIVYVLKYVPFFNFVGTAQGLKSINIILWKLILYILIIFIIIYIIRKIYIKSGLEEKLNNTIVEANIISKIGGMVVSVPLIMLLYFNVILILLSPNFNIKYLKDSKVSSFIMEKTPVFSSLNNNLYENEVFIIELLNQDEITKENYESINDDILANYNETNLIEDNLLDELDEKLLGKRTDKKVEPEENEDYDEESEEEEEEEDWSEEDEDEEDWSEEDWSEEDWSEEDWSEEDWSEEDWSEEDW